MSVEALHKNLRDGLALPDDAVSFLMMLFEISQTFDDFADGDDVSRSRLDALIWNTLVGMPENRFYNIYQKQLTPIIATTVLKWQASDIAERGGQADAKTYGWRAGFYDIVLFVFNLVHGPEAATQNAAIIMNLYGETIESYMQEFNDA